MSKQVQFFLTPQLRLRLFLMAAFLFVATSVSYLVHLPQSLACSLMDGQPEELQRAMAPQIAQALTKHLQREIKADEIPFIVIGKPSVVYLDGLGSRCEGLDNAIRVASFTLDKKFKDGAHCRAAGVIVMRGYWLNAANVAFHTRIEEAACE